MEIDSQSQHENQESSESDDSSYDEWIPCGVPVEFTFDLDSIGNTPVLVDFYEEVWRKLERNPELMDEKIKEREAYIASLQEEAKKKVSARHSFGAKKSNMEDPLQAAIARIEARVSQARQVVSSPTPKRRRIEESMDDFLDAEDDAGMDNFERKEYKAEDFVAVDGNAFFAQKRREKEEKLNKPETAESSQPAETPESPSKEEGTSTDWRDLIQKLDEKKRDSVFEALKSLDDALFIAGSTRHKKLKLLKEAIGIVRRLGPKPLKHQNEWLRCLTILIEDAPLQEIKTELVALIWEESDVKIQKEEIIKQKEDILKSLTTLSDNAGSSGVTATQILNQAALKNEVFSWKRFDKIALTVRSLFDLWKREEECSGRCIPPFKEGRKPSSQEKKFAAYLASLLALSEQASLMITKVALFGSKKTSGSTPTQTDEEDSQKDSYTFQLPLKIWLYKKNPLLQCKLNEMFSFSNQQVTVLEREWSGATREYPSLISIFDAYQQRYVKSQDRQELATTVDVFRFFATKHGNDFVTLYDILLKSAFDWCFMDKQGFPLYVLSISNQRQVELAKVKQKSQLPPASSSAQKQPPLPPQSQPIPQQVEHSLVLENSSEQINQFYPIGPFDIDHFLPEVAPVLQMSPKA
jgi:hypothetical protein